MVWWDRFYGSVTHQKALEGREVVREMSPQDDSLVESSELAW